MITPTIDKQEEVRLTAVRWFEFMSKGDVEKLCAMTDPGWIINGGLPGMPLGPDGIRKLFENVGHVKQQWMINDIIAERDKVVVRATNRSVQDVFLGFKEHGNRQVSSAIFIHRIVAGKVVETWRNADDLGSTPVTTEKARPSFVYDK